MCYIEYVQYCAELKTTLQNVASTLQLLKSAMTAHLVYKNDIEEKYQCMVEDGTLAGKRNCARLEGLRQVRKLHLII